MPAKFGQLEDAVAGPHAASFLLRGVGCLRFHGWSDDWLGNFGIAWFFWGGLGLPRRAGEKPQRRSRRGGEREREETGGGEGKAGRSLHVSAAHLEFQPPAGRRGLRDSGGERGRRAARPLPLVAARRASGLRGPQQERVGAEGTGRRRLPHRQFPRTLPHPGEPQVHQRVAHEAAGAVARGALPGGREAARAPAGAGGQIQGAEEVSAPQNHLGWRAENPLLQGEDPALVTRMVFAGSISESQ